MNTRTMTNIEQGDHDQGFLKTMTMSAKKHDHEINKVIITKRNRQGDDDAIDEKTCQKMKQIFTCEEDVEQCEK